MELLRPVKAEWVSTFNSHKRRNPPSSEAGTDYGCDIGTPILAADDGTIYETGGGVNPATGRYVTIDMDNGFRTRYLHLLSFEVGKSQRVKRGDVIALSGASGYGSEFFGADSMHHFPWADTGGPHTHQTLWDEHRYSFGNSSHLVDVELYVGGNQFSNVVKNPLEEMDMSTIEIITCPAYEAAGQRVVTNGSACMAIPAGWTIEHIQKGITFRVYDTNDAMLNEVAFAWQLGGLDNLSIENKLKEIAGAIGKDIKLENNGVVLV